ncbi:MAG: magnesium transporter [Alphaproteobacteria bacterium]|nr:magnesium transporter [Alphaproteobacteria bacterium]MCB9690607.1 magnesium transporter [Alphaproteobacteria bacterium]
MAGINQRTEALLRRLVRREAAGGIRKLLARTRPEDLAAAMEMLTWAEQRRLIGLIDDMDYAATVLANVSDEFARQFFENAEEGLVVELLERMEPDDATDIVENLPDHLRDRVLNQLESEDADVRDLLEWPSDSAGGIMSPLAFKMRQTATCGEAIASLQRQHEELEAVHYVYCVDGEERLVGVTSLRSLLTHAPDTPLVALMTREVIQVGPRTDQEEVARFVARYDLLAVPVVDRNGRILGIITVDDVLDVIEDEAAEDMMLMAGMSEGPSQGAFQQSLRRAGWLMATLVGGILMAEIIGIYEATLATVAVLAGFIPVIMGMGGNVGIQSATVAVRGLATGHVQLGGGFRFVFQEAQVGILLGLLFATLLGTYGGVRFGIEIGAAVAMSVCLSIAAASAIGGAIPVLLSRMGADPAIATGPFVTTSVDILAVLIYFNVARAMLGL